MILLPEMLKLMEKNEADICFVCLLEQRDGEEDTGTEKTGGDWGTEKGTAVKGNLPVKTDLPHTFLIQAPYLPILYGK